MNACSLPLFFSALDLMTPCIWADHAEIHEHEIHTTKRWSYHGQITPGIINWFHNGHIRMFHRRQLLPCLVLLAFHPSLLLQVRPKLTTTAQKKCNPALMGCILCWVEKMCSKAANDAVWWRSFDNKVRQQSLEVFLHYWQSSTVRAHYSRSSTAFWCQWRTLAKFTHHFWSPKVIFEVHQSLVKFYEAHMWFIEVLKFIEVHQYFHAFLKFNTKFDSCRSCNIHPGLLLWPQTRIYKHS